MTGKNNYLLLYVAFVFVLLSLVLIMILFINDRVNKEKEDSIFLTNNSNAKYSFLHVLYTAFYNFKPTHRYLESLHRQFELLMPNDERYAKENAIKIALTVWGISGIALLFTVLLTPSIFMIICVCTLIYVLNAQVVNKAVRSVSFKLLTGMDDFFTDVRSFYIETEMVDEAVYEAMCNCKSGIVKAHAEKIYKVLTAVDIEEALYMYNETVPNQFLQRFVSICVTNITYGDTKVDKQSLFLLNLKNIRLDLNEEIRKIDDVNFRYKFLVIITIVPIFALDAAKAWGISTLPELEEFYNGQWGILAAIACFVCTIFCYIKICFLKEPQLVDKTDHYFLKWFANLHPVEKFLTNYHNENYGKMMQMLSLLKRTGSKLNDKLFLLKRLCTAIAAFFLTVLLCIVLFLNTKYRSITYYNNVGNSANSATEEEIIESMLLAKYYTLYYKDFDWKEAYRQYLRERNSDVYSNEDAIKYWQDTIIYCIDNEYRNIQEEDALDIIFQYNETHSASSQLATVLYGTTLSSLDNMTDADQYSAEQSLHKILNKVNEPGSLQKDNLKLSIAEEVTTKVCTYQNSYFHWYYLIFAIIASIIGYFLPYYQLISKRKLLQEAMEDEVILYQSIILSLIHYDQMDVLTILQWLQTFSTIFYESITKCINTYSAGEDEALATLIDDEPFPPFKRIVENLMACDRIGVEAAFNELDAELYNFQEERKQTNFKTVTSNSSTAGILAFAPLMFVIFLYLVAPFLIESFAKLTAYMTETGAMTGGM